MTRQAGDTGINSIDDLDGEAGGRIRLADLIAYPGQSRIQACLANGVVDAFGVDQPIYYRACNNPATRGYGKIVMIPGYLASQPYNYTIAVAASASNYRLLKKANEFIAHCKNQPERVGMERTWKGSPVESNIDYRDEPGNLCGEAELEKLFHQYRE